MRPEKQEIIDEIYKKIDGSNAVILVDYMGLKAGKATELRKQLSAASTDYMVVKNTHLSRALEKAEIKGVEDHLKKSTAVLFVHGDQAETVKILVKYARANEFPKIKIGVINKNILPKEKIEYLATLPSKDVMIATVISRLKSPIFGLVIVLSGIERKFLYAINAIKEKKEKEQPKQEAATQSTGDAPGETPVPDNK